MTKENANREAKSKTHLRRGGAVVAALALTAGLSLVAAPAYADNFGYANCYPNHAPYMEAYTESRANGSVIHSQTNGQTEKRNTYWQMVKLVCARW